MAEIQQIRQLLKGLRNTFHKKMFYSDILTLDFKNYVRRKRKSLEFDES